MWQEATAQVLATKLHPGAPRPHLLSAPAHVCDPVTILKKMSPWTRAWRPRGGAAVRLWRNRGGADRPSHARVQPSLRGRLSRRWPQYGGRAPIARAIRGAAGLGAADDQRGLHFRYRRWPTCSLAFMTVSMPGAELGLADHLRAFRTEMAEAAADGRYYCLTPVLVAAWKRTGGEIRPRSFVTSPLLLAAQMLGSYITAGTPSDDSAGTSIVLGDRRHANGMRGAR